MSEETASPPADDQYREPAEYSRTRIDSIHAPGATFHFGPGGSPGDEPKYTTGAIGADEVRKALDGHVSRDIDGALAERLAVERCVILLGAPGTGRRTAALNALQTEVDERSLVELGWNESTDLGNFSFGHRQGYLLDATSVLKPATKFTGALLRSVQARLRSLGSCLVVIGLRGQGWDDIDDHFTTVWEPVSLAELLTSRGFDPPISEDDEHLSAVLGDGPTVAEISAVLDLIAAGRAEGRSDEETLADLPERHRAEIRQWFAEKRSLTEWALMSSLVFFSSTPKPHFDVMHQKLLERIDREIPASDEDSTIAREDLTRSIGGELQACCAEIRHSSQAIDEVVVRRQLICFRNEPTAHVFLEEYWKCVPRRLQKVVMQWLAEGWDQVDHESSERLAHRVATVVRSDADLGLSIVEHWAATAHPQANKLAARTMDILATSAATRPLAFAVARNWAMARKEIPKQYSALYVYTGHAGVFQIRQAVRVYRSQWKHRPFWTTSAWAGLTELCASTATQADELAGAMRRLGVVRKAEIDDPAFKLLDRWFVDDLSAVPLALRLAASAPARKHIAAIVACTLWRSYRHMPWLESIVPWADAEDDQVSETALRLLRASLLAIRTSHPDTSRRDANHRVDRFARVCDSLIRHMGSARRSEDGPSPLAIERCTKVIELLSPHLERNPAIHA